MRRYAMITGTVLVVGVLVLLFAVRAAQLSQPGADDDALRTLIDTQGIEPLPPAPEHSEAVIALGQALFFDKELSGNRDISCATCHHPLLHTTDRLALSLGTGNTGLGTIRTHEENRPFIPRNAPDIFNRSSMSVMFWDGRVQQADNGRFLTPADVDTPWGLDNALAAQAIFPITSIDEMRGKAGDLDVFGQENELALLPDGDFPLIWAAIMERLLAIPEYVAMFQAAYPNVKAGAFNIVHYANAIGAFEGTAFNFTDSPWNRYVSGDDAALSEDAKAGALLFFGEAGCSACHSGTLLTDLQFHNIGVPQLGPGKEFVAPLDIGHGMKTRDALDRFTFRTPSLHNVTLTAPYMHNGAYTTLEAVIQHKLDPRAALMSYDGSGLVSDLRLTLQQDDETIQDILAALDPLCNGIPDLNEDQVDDLVSFLEALTDPAAANLSHTIPVRVPSGLPVGD